MKQARALRWLFFVLIVLGAGGWAVSGLVVYARLAYIGLFILASAGLWAVLSLRGIRLNRSTRTLRASMGDVFEEHFEIHKLAWPGCLWLEVLNKSDLPAAGGSRILTSIGVRQRRFYTARTVLTRRGAFQLGPTVLSSGDLFGIFTMRRQFSARDTLVVLPMTVAIKDFPPPPGLLPGGKAVRQHTADVTPNTAGVREYVPGDPMKRIHWPSTARRGRFMVKEFEQDPQADIWIFLDAQRDSHLVLPETQEVHTEESWWLRRPKVSLPPETFEYAISAAASLARYFLAERRAVGLASAAGKFTVVSADRGERQVSKIMETLALLQPEGTMPMLGLVTMQAKLLQLGSGVIMITPSVRPELLLAVEDLQRRSLRPVVVLIKSETFGGTADSAAMAAGLMRRNVPACQIGLKDDLAVQLALPAVYFKRPYLPRSYFSVSN